MYKYQKRRIVENWEILELTFEPVLLHRRKFVHGEA
jgi:hypothetical protein